MCGRVIQSSTPFRLAIVEGLDVRDSRVHNYPPRWNGAPSQELLVCRTQHACRLNPRALSPGRSPSSPGPPPLGCAALGLDWRLLSRLGGAAN